jgi:protein-S-isoprenylcysteine O-methyltransferase Ste14
VARLTEAANAGWVRPPLVYLGAIALGFGLHAAWPLTFGFSGLLPGAAAVLAAVVLLVSAVRTMRAAGTPVPGDRPTTAIVGAGPYRYSRNPIYLAFSLLQVGLALCVDSPWLLVTLVPAVALMSLIVIPREERYLEIRFGSKYLAYKAAVRRWL